MSPSDSDLIARVLARDDRGAFGELVRRHQSSVRAFLRHLVHPDHALADDLAQDTFLQAYQRLGRFEGRATFSTWLLGIAFNHHRNARRRPRFEPLDDAAAESAHAPGTAPTRDSDLRHDLAEALDRLSPDERLVLHLAYQQGLSHGEIATLVDWPLGTVKTHLARSKDKLRELLAAWNPQT